MMTKHGKAKKTEQEKVNVLEITEVRTLSGGGLHVKWQETVHDAKKVSFIESKEAPLPEFNHAFKALLHPAVSLCDIPDEHTYMANCEVRALNIKRKPTKPFGADVTWVKKVSGTNSGHTVTSPYTSSEIRAGDDDGTVILNEHFLKAIAMVVIEASRYAAGEVAQRDLSEQGEFGDDGAPENE